MHVTLTYYVFSFGVNLNPNPKPEARNKVKGDDCPGLPWPALRVSDLDADWYALLPRNPPIRCCFRTP